MKVSQLAEEKKQKQDNQIIHLRKHIHELEGEIAKAKERLGSKKEFEEQLVSAAISAEPFPRFRYTRVSKKSVPIVPVLNLSDHHIGEQIQKGETEGFGEYNYEIAKRRLLTITNDFLHWVELNRKFYLIEHCTINELGDFVSGDIHEELLRTNEFPLPVQVAKSGTLLGEIHRWIASHFKTVAVNQVGADNHGRLVKKPQNKSAAANNVNFLVYSIANNFADRCTNIRINTADGIKMIAEINTKKFLLEHGHTIRGGTWGIPAYSIARMKGKESGRRMNTKKGFDYWQFGHFHVPLIPERNTLINGSLSGTSEYDHAAGRFAEPAQLAYLIHPRHGLFDWTPFQDS